MLLQQHFLALFITFIASLALALFVFLKGPRKSVNISYAIYTLAIACWSIFQAFAMTLKDFNTVVFLWKMQHLGVTWIPVLFLNFVFTLFTKEMRLFKRSLLYAAFGWGVIFSYINLNGSLFQVVGPKFYFSYYLEPNAYYIAFFISWIFIACCGLIGLFRMYFDSTSEHKKKYGYFAFSMAAAYVVGGSNFLPIFDIYIPVLIPFGTYTVPIYLICAAYAIIALGLLDITVIIKKSFIYSTLILFLSLLYIILVFGTHHLVLGQTDLEPSFALNIAALLSIAMLYKPAEYVIQRILDRLFFKGDIQQISDQKDVLAGELERRERLKSVGVLAAGMAHEIKNPITSLRTFTEFLPEKYDDPDFRNKFVRIVRQETDRIGSIAKDLLMYSKPSDPKPIHFDLLEMINEIQELLSAQLMKSKVNMSIEGSEAHVFADPLQIKQAVVNIVVNAIEAMKESGGNIYASIHDNGDYLNLSIQDTGPGIVHEKIKHIFDPFYTNRDHGTGLGLAITHSLLESNKGHISVTSRKDQGACFVIKLPKRSCQIS